MLLIFYPHLSFIIASQNQWAYNSSKKLKQNLQSQLITKIHTQFIQVKILRISKWNCLFQGIHGVKSSSMPKKISKNKIGWL